MRIAKNLFCFLWAVWLCYALAGCGAAAQPETEMDVLRVGTTMRVKSTNPVGNYGYSQFAMLLTHDTLVRFDADFSPYGQLAEQWTSDPEGRTWTFELRSDRYWHDGTPVTPQDVRFTFGYLYAKNIGGYAWLDRLIREIRIDGNRITFDLHTPYARFLENAGYIVRILPKHVWEAIDDPHKAFGPALAIGNGPYILQEFDQTANIVRFLRNDSYPADSLPDARRIDFHIFTNYDTLSLALSSGQVDLFYRYASGFPPNYLERLEKAPHVHLVRSAAMGVPLALGFNLKEGPASALKVRRAISLAIDYAQMNRSLLAGTGTTPTAGFVPPVFPEFQQRPPLERDPAEARALMREAGFAETPGAPSLSMQLIARNDLPNQLPVMRLLQRALADIGIDLQIRSSDLSTWVDRVNRQEFDLLLFRTTPWGMMMGAGTGTGYFDARRQGGGSIANIADADFYALCDNLLATTDPDRVRRLQGEVQHYYATRLPAIALCWGIDHFPHGHRWSGYTLHPMEGGVLNRLTLQSLGRAAPDGDKAGP